MKLTSRVLLGTLAMTAAVSGSAASVYAETAGAASGGDSGSASVDDSPPSATESLLCPFVTSGPIHSVLNGLNPVSAADACAGPNTNLVTGNKAAANQPAAAADGGH